jgi:hypothetical protein
MSSGISVGWLFAAYVAALLIELSRLAFRMPYRLAALLGVTVVGLLLHAAYLFGRFFPATSPPEAGALPAGQDLLLVGGTSWYDWVLLVAWALAAVYAVLLVRKPESQLGLFVLPLLITLVALATGLRSLSPLERAAEVAWVWRAVHAISLLVGTMLLSLGFAVSWMYLFQAFRLKHRHGWWRRLKLPSLEYLQTLGGLCLRLAALSVAIGVASGIAMNLTRDGQVRWLDGGVTFTAGLLLWLVIASFAQWRLTQRGLGRWTAYLNLASFLVLVVSLLVVIAGSHAGNQPPIAPEASPPASLSGPPRWEVAQR